MGPTTQRFFAEGEQHEATRWEDAHLPPDEVANQPPDPEAAFDSFDEVPKRRRPVLAVVAIGAFLLIGVAAWTMAFQVLRTRPAIRAWFASVVGSKVLPPLVEAPMSSPVATGSSAAVSTREAAADLALPRTAPPGAPANTSLAIPSAPTAPTPAPEQAGKTEELPVEGARTASIVDPTRGAVAAPTPSPQSVDRHRPLRGYVWSPRAKTLVPADAPGNDPIGARNADTMEAAPREGADLNTGTPGMPSSPPTGGAPTMPVTGAQPPPFTSPGGQ